MGVVNATPDSFSDGGRFGSVDAAVEQGLRLVEQGADIVDVGGEATNPRAQPVTAEEEMARVLPVIERLARAGVVVSVDTTKATVAEAAVAAGARIVNDVSGGLFDDGMGEAAARTEATYICGHLRGRSIAEVFSVEQRATWTAATAVAEVTEDLRARLAALPSALADRTWIDPGLGFGKGGDASVNLALASEAVRIGHTLGRRVVVGPSRKRFLRAALAARGVTDPSEADLDAATVEVCRLAIATGPCVLRVHNVALLHTVLTAYNKE
jgi:dihydropteroate synthase